MLYNLSFSVTVFLAATATNLFSYCSYSYNCCWRPCVHICSAFEACFTMLCSWYGANLHPHSLYSSYCKDTAKHCHKSPLISRTSAIYASAALLPLQYCIVHGAFCVVHCAFCTVSCVFCIVLRAFCIVHCAFSSVRCSFFTVLFTFCIVDYAFCTVHFALYAVYLLGHNPNFYPPKNVCLCTL